MPSFKNIAAGLALYLSATSSVMVLASPVAAGNEAADKRQAAILPPPGCGDEQAFFNCATDNPQYCFAPSPITVAQW